MDGNRRWAKKRGLSATEGHWSGAKTAKKVVKCAAMLGVKAVTILCFSQATLMGRSSHELEGMFSIMVQYLNQKRPDLLKSAICIKTIGDLSVLPISSQKALHLLEEETSAGSEFMLTFALNYNGRDEMRRAITKIAGDIESGVIHKEDISNHLIESYVDTAGTPDVDFFIRTGNDHFITGAWNLHYTQCFFPDLLWPDFNEQNLIDIRAFCKTKEKKLFKTFP